MRAVVQRVAEARVEVDDQVVGAIGPGLLVLVGVTHDDGPAQAVALARKVHELRIIDDERSTDTSAASTAPSVSADTSTASTAPRVSAADVDAPLLVVSQFTLYADTRKGRRPSWSAAAPSSVAEPLVGAVVTELRRRGARVETGTFGAHMRVVLTNDGPVTILLEV